MGLRTHSVKNFPVPVCITEIDHLATGESLHLFPDPWSESYYGRKAKWKPLELPLPMKAGKQKQHCIPGGTVEIGATSKGLESAGGGSSPHSHSICLFGLYGRQILENDSGLL